VRHVQELEQNTRKGKVILVLTLQCFPHVGMELSDYLRRAHLGPHLGPEAVFFRYSDGMGSLPTLRSLVF
jgi:hypothetical protein